MLCLGFEPGTEGWLVQMDPMNVGAKNNIFLNTLQYFDPKDHPLVFDPTFAFQRT